MSHVPQPTAHNAAETARLAALFRAEREALPARWHERVRGLPGAAGLAAPALNDHVPDLIGELVCELEAACDPGRLPPPVSENPEVHGRQRFDVGFDLAEVVAEYGLLRSEGLIDYTRGSIRILDRAGMERLARGCYGRVKGEYERLFSDEKV